MTPNHFKLVIMLVCIVHTGCQKRPKVIPMTIEDQQLIPSAIFDDRSENNVIQLDNDFHQVSVNEVLPTEKYVYLNVTESENTYWIATLKMEARIGDEFIYKGSVLQSNFESKEHDRTFEEVYFVSEIIPATHGMEDISNRESNKKPQNNNNPSIPVQNIKVEGSMPIRDLVSDPEKYESLVVQISGMCVKVNPEIMGRNWIHLKDGSKDDFDLVITSDALVTEGQIVTMTGVVGLDRDFGAGYRYDLILEGGKIIN